MLLLSYGGRGAREGGRRRGRSGLSGGARKHSLENCPVAGVRAWPASLSFAIHYPAWLMHQSGKFDFFAEKGGRREAWGREGPAGAAQGLACLRFAPGSDSQGRRPAVEGRGPGSWGASGGRWAEVRAFRSLPTAGSFSICSLLEACFYFPCCRSHL